MDLWMQEFERKCVRELEREMAHETQPGYSRTTTFAFMDIAYVPCWMNSTRGVCQADTPTCPSS